MSTFIERLTIETTELDEKLSKLKTFIDSDKFNGVDAIQKSLLKSQFHAMSTYSQILHERVLWLDMPADKEG